MKRLKNIYRGMVERCTNPRFPYYYRYGGRGITVCDEWLRDSKMFFDWALSNGYEDDLEIDRINNDKGYTPDNCRFVNRRQNMRNTCKAVRVSFRGQIESLSELCEKYSLNYNSIFVQLKRNPSLDVEELIYRKAMQKTIKQLNHFFKVQFYEVRTTLS